MISVDEGWAVGLDGVILRYGDFSSVAINYSSGAPGSYFTVTGEHFPPNSSASVSINGHFLGTVQTDSSGNLIFLLNTDQANAGYYSVVVHENPEAEVSFLLDSDDPLRPKENDGVIFNVPGGIAYSHQIYLPLNQK